MCIRDRANGGFEVTPHVTSTFKERYNKNPKKQFFSNEVSKTVLEWMESVVDKGSGSGVKIEDYRIAGKTGTSQKALNGSYTSKKFVVLSRPYQLMIQNMLSL